jgi:hypothetical protein
VQGQASLVEDTMANTETESADFCPIDIVQRNAYNAAFSELGLVWRWGNETLARLQPIADERERVRTYLREEQEHLLRAYDADFLVDAILKSKARLMSSIEAESLKGPTERAESTEHHAHEIGF